MTFYDLQAYLKQYKEALTDETALRSLSIDPAKSRPKRPALDAPSCRKDIADLLAYLTASLEMEEDSAFLDYIRWLAESSPFPSAALYLDCYLENLLAVLKQRLPQEDLSDLKTLFNHAIDLATLKNSLSARSFADKYPQATALLAPLLEMKEEDARACFDRYRQELDIKALYLEVIEPALWRLGELWQNQQISVAMEHYCTAILQKYLALLYEQLFKTRQTRNVSHAMLGVCAGPELHEIGIRMVTDFLEADGWDTVYLGANVPIDSVLAELQKRRYDLIGISATTLPSTRYARALIEAIRKCPALAHLKVMVGGRIFVITPSLWQKVGADGCSYNAQDATRVAWELVRESL